MVFPEKNIENRLFRLLALKKHPKSFVSIIDFEKNIENRSFRLLALQKTSKIARFNYYTHRPGLV